MNPNDQEAQRKADTQAFEEEIQRLKNEFPNCEIKEYTFNKFEQQLLAEQQTIAVLAGQTQNKIINEICLKGVGITPSPAIQVRYTIGLGRFVCFIPKLPKMEDAENVDKAADTQE